MRVSNTIHSPVLPQRFNPTSHTMPQPQPANLLTWAESLATSTQNLGQYPVHGFGLTSASERYERNEKLSCQ